MNNNFKYCQICKNQKLIKSFSLGKLPLCDDLIPLGSKKRCITYPVNIWFCKNCITAYNTFRIIENRLFPKNYHYRSRLTNDVLNGMQDLVLDVEKKFGKLKNKVVLDIGCNDCSLLNYFKKKGAITIGIEPTNAIKDNLFRHNFLIQKFFNLEAAKIIKKKYNHIDYIVFTNVFAHINNFESLIKGIKHLLNSNTKLIIENHYLGSVIKKNQFDTFYHEHPRTYSLSSFYFISKLLGLNLTYFNFPKRYGGNIRVFLSRKKNNNKNKINFFLEKEKIFFSNIKNMKKKIDKWILKKRKLIALKYKKYGKLSAKGFPGRATILINLLKIKKFISVIYEKDNSPKVGYFAPGTRIPILQDKILFKMLNKPKYIINLAWHIKKEIKTYLKTNFVKSKIINIVDNSDFN